MEGGETVMNLFESGDVNDTLQVAISNGIISIEQIASLVNDMKRQEILSHHPYEIWQNKEGMYLTYVYNEDGIRKIRRRKTLKELEDYLVDYYSKLEEIIYISDVFEQWSSEKLEFGEIQKQSYDRYVTDFQRFFKKSLPICQKKFKNITESDLEAFIKTTIVKENLTHKAYTGLATLVKGIFKYGKKHGYTTLSITNFMGDLQLARNVFRKTERCKEKETFSEDEIPNIITFLKANPDIWNLGLLLQFQTGMRIGEIAALKGEDLGDGFIHVCRTEIKYKNEEGKWKVTVQEHPKTDAGNRRIVIPPQAVETTRQILNLNPHGEYLFMNNGKRIRENTFNKRLSAVCEKLGIETKSTHKIRKTYGTALLDNNVDDSFVAEQMGHTDVTTTRKLYYYSNRNEKTKRAQIANAISF